MTMDLTGYIYDRWRVINFAGFNSKRKATWSCMCQCGNTRIVAAASLRSGKSKSCGCLQREVMSKTGKNNLGKFEDLTGQTFGKLTVIKFDKRINGDILFLCQCECGNIRSIRRYSLVSYDTLSCGCLRSSGETSIELLRRLGGIS